MCLGDAAVGRVVTSSSTLGQDEVGGVDVGVGDIAGNEKFDNFLFWAALRLVAGVESSADVVCRAVS